MTPTADPELLVVGGLAIDQFRDGTTHIGGSVTYAARAMHLEGRLVAVVTIAGSERLADSGLDELRRMAEVHAQRAGRSIAFGHDEHDGRRELMLVTVASEPLRLPPLPFRPAAVLYAPVAHELAADLAGQRYPDATGGAVLQGWLRRQHSGHVVEPVPLSSLDPLLVGTLASLDLLVASMDDLEAEGGDPWHRLGRMREAFGARPTLVLTGGVDGAWVDVPDGGRLHVDVPRAIRQVSTVGAGDAFAAGMLAALARGVRPADAAADAGVLVAEVLAARTGRTVHVIGDVHGMRDRLEAALRASGLIDAEGRWAGGRDEVWLAGDLVDRGPDGIGVVELLMRLQEEADAAGGRVGSVIGNHEIQLLAARVWPDGEPGDGIRTFHADWLANGGHPSELQRLQERHVRWLRELPVAARIGPALLVHSDAPLHDGLAPSVTATNARVAEMLRGSDPHAWDRLLALFSGRRAFLDPAAARALLHAWGGREVVHGHTTVSRLFGVPPAAVGEPIRYANGMAVAVDGGAFGGGRLLVHRISD